MAAISNGPFGFRPIRHYGGGEVRTRTYPITGPSTNYNTAIYFGDLVKIASGYVQVVSSNTSLVALGVFMGVYYTDPNVKQPRWAMYWPGFASGVTDAYAIVADDPGTVFQISTSGSTALASTSNFLNANITFGTGSTATGLSGMQLDPATVATTNTLNLRIHNRVLLPGNDWSDTGGDGKNLLLEVTLNNGKHYYQQTTAT